MNNETVDYVVTKTKEMMDASSCSAEAKVAGQTWLDSLGTDNEVEASKKYFDEIEATIAPIDGVIGFLGSDTAIEMLGEETASNILAHMKEIKSEGAINCDCPACSSASAILEKKDIILG